MSAEAARPRAISFSDEPSSNVMGWACGACGTPFSHKQSKAAFDLAKLCCSKRQEPVEPREAKLRLEEATKIPLSSYRGVWLYAEGVYFERETLADVQHDRLERNAEPLEYAWACEPDAAAFDVVEAVIDYVDKQHDKGLTDEIDQGMLDAAQVLVDEALSTVVSQRIRRDLVVLLPVFEEDSRAGDAT